MVKKHSKRARNDFQDEERTTRPLGSVPFSFAEEDKDEEEKRLEALLFGTKFAAHETIDSNTFEETGDMGRYPDKVNDELNSMMDSDLFFFDSGDAGSSAPTENTTILPENATAGDGTLTVSSNVMPPTSINAVSAQPSSSLPSNRRKAAWVDPDDTNIQISLASEKRLRKLRDTAEEDTIGGKDYEYKLRRHYEKIQPVPNWASTARDCLAKKRRRRSSESSGSDEETKEFTSILNSSSGLLSISRNRALPSGHLSIERLRDANQSAKAEGPIKSVKFHPSPSVPLLLVTSSDRRLRLFNIDGHTNPHLQSVHIPSLPVTSAMFHPSGSSVLLTGNRPFYYMYDLQSGNCTRSPRGLWGTHAGNPDTIDLSMETCAFNSTGDILAVAGRRGYIHIVDWRRGGGQVVADVKMNSGVKDLWWSTEHQLMTLGDDSEVYLWDVNNRRCLRRWKEYGGFGTAIMTGSSNNRYLAIGSSTGIVSLYGSEAISGDQHDIPKPLKTIGNLTTSISSMHFNNDAQILALASKNKKDQLKMVHLPSLSVFANWPTSTTPLGHVTSLDFSPSSDYTAIGNSRGRVLLYNLRHFSSK